MEDLKLLDCTLRDGGRIIDCQFSCAQMQNLTSALEKANIDFIEIGFLDDTKKDIIAGNSTYFHDIREIPHYTNLPFSRCCVFANFGKFNFNSLPPYNTNLPQGIRIGFTMQNFMENSLNLKKIFRQVRKLGYTVFMQPLNTPEYNDDCFLQLLNFANDIKPYSFAIVDTFGAMLEEDLNHYFDLISQTLKPDINLDFHSHNNLQLSFAHAIWLTKQNLSGRNLIIDSTLQGIGRGGGNLNTELIANYLNSHYGTKYNIKTLIQIIDKEILPFKQTVNWGYSIPAFLGGIYKIHPHNLNNFYEEYLYGKN